MESGAWPKKYSRNISVWLCIHSLLYRRVRVYVVLCVGLLTLWRSRRKNGPFLQCASFEERFPERFPSQGPFPSLATVPFPSGRSSPAPRFFLRWSALRAPPAPLLLTPRLLALETERQRIPTNLSSCRERWLRGDMGHVPGRAGGQSHWMFHNGK